MIRKHLQLLCILVLTLLFFTACKDDQEYVAPSNTELLVAHEWKGDQVLVMGINIAEMGAGRPNIPDIQTLRLRFNRDNSYVAQGPNGLEFEGDWHFNEDETKIHFDFLGLGEFDVKKLTSEHFNISTAISKSQLVLLTQMLNIQAEILHQFPDGTEFETELRFVKP